MAHSAAVVAMELVSDTSAPVLAVMLVVVDNVCVFCTEDVQVLFDLW